MEPKQRDVMLPSAQFNVVYIFNHAFDILLLEVLALGS